MLFIKPSSPRCSVWQLKLTKTYFKHLKSINIGTDRDSPDEGRSVFLRPSFSTHPLYNWGKNWLPTGCQSSTQKIKWEQLYFQTFHDLRSYTKLSKIFSSHVPENQWYLSKVSPNPKPWGKIITFGCYNFVESFIRKKVKWYMWLFQYIFLLIPSQRKRKGRIF